MSDSAPLRTSAPDQTRRRGLGLVGIWVFPYLLAGAAYAVGSIFGAARSLRTSVTATDIPSDVYLWLLIMVVLSVVWLVSEFLAVTNRETVVRALQWDAAISTATAAIFSGAAGWFIAEGELEWWFLVPWIAAVIDAFTSSWLGINNAAQKPFLSHRGSM